MRLCLDAGLRRIYSRYVPLSGGYRPARELSPTYSRILVRGDGPQRTIERVRLDDIRQAVSEHPSFILLTQPSAGKTTVLQRLALEMALKRLQTGGDALVPLFARLAAQKLDETPHAMPPTPTTRTPTWKTWTLRACAACVAGDGQSTVIWCGAPTVTGTTPGAGTAAGGIASPGPALFSSCPLSAVTA